MILAWAGWFSVNLILPFWFGVNGGAGLDVNETCFAVDLFGVVGLFWFAINRLYGLSLSQFGV